MLNIQAQEMIQHTVADQALSSEHVLVSTI